MAIGTILGQQPDLSNTLTKDEASGLYLTKTEANQNYATKSEISNIQAPRYNIYHTSFSNRQFMFWSSNEPRPFPVDVKLVFKNITYSIATNTINFYARTKTGNLTLFTFMNNIQNNACWSMNFKINQGNVVFYSDIDTGELQLSVSGIDSSNVVNVQYVDKNAMTIKPIRDFIILSDLGASYNISGNIDIIWYY